MTNAADLQSSFQALFVKYAPAAIAICDKEMRYLAHSDRWSKDYGFGGENLVGYCHYDLFPEIPNHWKKDHQRCFKGEIIRRDEEPFPRANGRTDWVRRELYPWKDSAGKIGGLIMFTEVVTERRQAQEALKESERKYRRLMENALVGVYKVREDGTFLLINQKMAEMFGFGSAKAFLKRVDNIKDLYLNPSERPEVLKEIDQKGFVIQKEVAFKNAEGEPLWIHLNTRRTEDGDGNIFYEGLMEDISELKRIQRDRELLKERLLTDQKNEAISDLAGGIAHQFNNALTAITGNIGLLEMDLPEGHEFLRNIKDMKASSHRMVNLTRQLLAYAQGGRYHLQTTSVGSFLENTLPLLEHTLKPDVRLEMDLPRETMRIKADRTQLQMVVSAVVANANEAIEHMGRIGISARNVEIDGNSWKGDMRPGSYVRITVSDDGRGMDEETQRRIFEPFFTTHFIGRGLGMAAVHGIITSHGGGIRVESQPGRGTRVHLFLPVKNEVKPPKEEISRETSIKRGKGTVLLIEDEPDVMEITRETLKRIGYVVVEAAAGAEAIQKAEAEDVDVALLDIKLPDMSGAEVYPRIMEAKPDLKVLVYSGYAVDGPAREILNAGADGFIQKPFSVQGLAEKLDEVLMK